MCEDVPNSDAYFHQNHSMTHHPPSLAVLLACCGTRYDPSDPRRGAPTLFGFREVARGFGLSPSSLQVAFAVWSAHLRLLLSSLMGIFMTFCATCFRRVLPVGSRGRCWYPVSSVWWKCALVTTRTMIVRIGGVRNEAEAI